MRLAIRVDASAQMGTGHFMRCLTLAAELRFRGAHICFISRYLPEHLVNLLKTEEYEFVALRNNQNEIADSASLSEKKLEINQEIDAEETIEILSNRQWDWLIVDHYSLDVGWESLIRPHVQKLMVIDDLANRAHDCDLLLDQNYYENLNSRYQGLISGQCIFLLGPEYALLRPEFSSAQRKFKKIRNAGVNRLLIFFGGTDPDNETRKALEALKLLICPQIAVDVVVGSANPHHDQIKKMCDEIPNVKYHCQISNMAELIGAADLAIGAGGAATWERCVLGLPTLTVVLAENQLQTTLDLEKFGATLFLGWGDQLTASDLAKSVETLVHNEQLLCSLSERAALLMEKWIGVRAVADAMEIY